MDLLRQSYPDDHARAGSQGWGDPHLYADAAGCRAAVVSSLGDDWQWSKLDDADKVRLTQLAAQSAPLTDLYNFVDYRMKQTVVYDPQTGVKDRRAMGSSWRPLVEPPNDRDPKARDEARSRAVQHINAADRNNPNRFLGASVTPGTPGRAASPAAFGKPDASGERPTAHRPQTGRQSGTGLGG
ncbi:hypothetical protein FB561_3062 [Kribbella amoyensis]|uniref:Uncharacterized protein n=1 Tax=Kribbella amoyensis TaxID=996641 RepID=A0A561BSR1_9ACTN|nr:hypothetical protein [Kribbella amoyensis]TWD81938.1 hypothetical protein FB561_3062 [Kribbella amoyensis]